MRGLIIGMYALLSAGTSQAERVSEPYTKVGDWDISKDSGACVMSRSYLLKDEGDEQELAVIYDAQREAAALGWATRKPKFPPLSASLDFRLSFTGKGSSLNERWGNQTFGIQKRADGYRFMHVFRGPTESDRFLRDVASSDTVGLWFGPSLMMGLPLSASDAVTKLRECSSNIVEATPR